jgi:hypothetical protein
MINVPTGVWIDERGRVVRPGEVAYSSDKSLTLGGKKLVVEGDIYVAALRDWVANGDASRYALRGEALARRMRNRTPKEAEADAAFQLGVHLFKSGKPEAAAKYWQRAQTLNPESWNYHRQEWSFTPQEAGKKWMAKFLALEDRPYYAPLDLPRDERKPDKKQ